MKTQKAGVLLAAGTGLGLVAWWARPSVSDAPATIPTVNSRLAGTFSRRPITAADASPTRSVRDERPLDGMFGFADAAPKPAKASAWPALHKPLLAQRGTVAPAAQDPLDDYAYAGAVTVDGTTMALIEHRSTRQGWYVGAGDEWQGQRVVSLNTRGITLLIDGVNRRLAKSNFINVVPLFADARGGANSAATVGVTQTLNQVETNRPQGAAQAQSGGRRTGNTRQSTPDDGLAADARQGAGQTQPTDVRPDAPAPGTPGAGPGSQGRFDPGPGGFGSFDPRSGPPGGNPGGPF